VDVGGGFALAYFGFVGTLIVRHTITWLRFDPDRVLRDLSHRAHGALLSGASLSPLREQITQALTRLAAASALDVHDAVADELRILLTVLAVETLDSSLAEATLREVARHALAPLARARLRAAAGVSPGYVRDASMEPLWRLLTRDINAQVDLFRDEHTTEEDVLPVTRARILARAGDLDSAYALLAALDPQRREVLERAFPDDPAVRLWRSRANGPYR